jgi:hypothetical protein
MPAYKMLTMTTFNAAARRLWTASPPMTAGGLVMIVAFVLSAAGIVLSPAVITGVPAWLKPTKFAISSAIYLLTLAWIFTYLEAWPRLTRIVGWTSAILVVFEVAVIDLQAARGVTSHFNTATALDAAIFAAMGLGILLVWLASIALTVAVFRQPFEDAALGWAIRLGLLITVLGSATGGVMVRPTDAQLIGLRDGAGLKVSGAHTVGAPDGGPGLPGTGWSTRFGDVRVAHFVGLHGVQVLPLFVWLRRRFRGTAPSRAGVFVAAASYGSLWVILLWQALRGQSVVAPDGVTSAVLASWLAATIVAALAASMSTTKTITPSNAPTMVVW